MPSRTHESLGEFWAARFECPVLPQSHVRRPRLLEILERAERTQLVLVSAAAGAGKTLMTAEWLQQTKSDRLTSWIRFENGDTSSFWSDLVRALRTHGLETPSAMPTDVDGSARHEDLVDMCAALSREESRVRLVLDDLELTSPKLAGDLDFLLRHTSGLQLVITTRMDPVLPLYRYRLQEAMVEVRTADLAFTTDETSELLQTHGITLSPDSTRALQDRTGGWAAGLRFAAMFLAECADPEAAVEAVTGDTGNIAEYLIGEVLRTQDAGTRKLLLSTSIADTLQPGLIETLGGPTAPHDLALLAKENTFLDQFNDPPGTYAYHPLFKELLRAELNYEAPEQWDLLHRRAAVWFAGHGQLSPSVAHAATVDAWPEAAGFIVDDLAVGKLLLERGSGQLTATLGSMPEDLADPSACVVRAAIALARSDHDADLELARAQEAIDPEDGSPRQRALRLAVSLLNAVRASCASDSVAARRLAEAAEDLLRRPEYRPKLGLHPELMALMHVSKGIACLRAGLFPEAVTAFTSGESVARSPGSEALLAECRGFLALINALRGHLTRAEALAARSVAASDSVNTPAEDRPPSALVAHAWVGLERYDLPSASGYLSRAYSSRFLAGDPVSRTMAAILTSRLQRAHGDLAHALASAERAWQPEVEDAAWLAERLRLEISMLHVAMGDPQWAEQTAAQMGSPANAAEIALVIAESKAAQGLDDTDPEIKTATDRDASVATRVSGTLVALRHDLRVGDVHHARALLERSLRLAAPEALRRPFREASPAVRQLMRKEPRLLSEHPWLEGVRTDVEPRATNGGGRAKPASSVFSEPADRVIEPLTGKEMEVLGHLAELLSTDEIAETMFVSANTIRTHVRSILRKLGVSRRNEAVRRARKLSLLST